MTTPNKQLRRKILEVISRGGSPHIASAFSMVEILNAVFRTMALEKIKDDDLASFHANGSLLAGHASHFVKYIEHSTGALGHGLSPALGMAIGLRALKSEARVFVLVGDGELHEGSNWEAIMLAGHLGMENLYVLVDSNGYDQMGPLGSSCGIEPLRAKFESFNFATAEVDGHSEQEIMGVIQKSENKKPTAVICRTVKGKGVSFMESNVVWHYRTPAGEEYEKALAELND